MRLITLCQLFQSDYNPKVACAFIFYTEGDKAYDHNGVLVGQFMPGNNKFSYDEHLRKVIVPLLTEKLNQSLYQPAFVDHYNQSPQPHLAMMRKDNADLTAGDITAIKATLVAIIAEHNKKFLPPRFFSKHLQHDFSKLQYPQPVHGYTFRTRK